MIGAILGFRNEYNFGIPPNAIGLFKRLGLVGDSVCRIASYAIIVSLLLLG